MRSKHASAGGGDLPQMAYTASGASLQGQTQNASETPDARSAQQRHLIKQCANHRAAYASYTSKQPDALNELSYPRKSELDNLAAIHKTPQSRAKCTSLAYPPNWRREDNNARLTNKPDANHSPCEVDQEEHVAMGGLTNRAPQTQRPTPTTHSRGSYAQPHLTALQALHK